MQEQKNPDVIFKLSVDSEEEWDCSGEFHQNNFSDSNVRQIPGLQAFCDRPGIRPAYFTDYAVADNSDAIEILKAMVENNNCEIGAHLHPWFNPPLYGITNERESHIINLPISQVEEKLDTLIDSALDKILSVIHMYMHGSSLIDGTTGHMKHNTAFAIICNNIEQVVEHTRSKSKISFCTISEDAVLLKQRIN